MASFTPQIQSWILASEGGYVDHPSDPGGATNMGITHRTLAAWRKVPSVTKQQVRDLTRQEALAIYEAQYWRTSGADRLPEGLDYAVFDYAVNSGPARAVKDLQRVVGVTADGIMGAQTLAAVGRYGAVRAIEGLTERRMAFLKALKTWGTFGRGWTRRVEDVSAKARKLAVGVAPDERPNGVPANAPGKAPPERPSVTDTLVKDAGGLSGIAAALAALFGAIADQPILQVAAVALVGVLVWRFVIAKREVDPS